MSTKEEQQQQERKSHQKGDWLKLLMFIYLMTWKVFGNAPNDMYDMCIITADGPVKATLYTDVLHSKPGIDMDGLIVILKVWNSLDFS